MINDQYGYLVTWGKPTEPEKKMDGYLKQLEYPA